MNLMKELAEPFPKRLIHTNPSGGGSYVKHHVVCQRLILALGYPPNFEQVKVHYGNVDGFTTNNGKVFPDLENVIVGVTCRMSVEIDGREVSVEDTGDCEQPHNWKTDGARLKDAMSDAYKRCAARLGVGLHLWSQDEFFLYDALPSGEETSEAPAREQAAPTTPAESSRGPQEGVPGDEPRRADQPAPSSPTTWQDDPWPIIQQARTQNRISSADLVRAAGEVAKRNSTMKLTVSPASVKGWPVEALEQLVYELEIAPALQQGLSV